MCLSSYRFFQHTDQFELYLHFESIKILQVSWKLEAMQRRWGKRHDFIFRHLTHFPAEASPLYKASEEPIPQNPGTGTKGQAQSSQKLLTKARSNVLRANPGHHSIPNPLITLPATGAPSSTAQTPLEEHSSHSLIFAYWHPPICACLEIAFLFKNLTRTGRYKLFIMQFLKPRIF